jgi:crotonobetainyl-CoA:carnitine CoA-transferase CaiB-like acyl-CoA transferase
MMAIFDRERTGVGRWVTTSLLEAQIFMLDFQASRWLIAKEVAPQAGNDHPTGIPTGVFPTSDGHINIAASSSRVFGRFCDAIGKSEWKDKPEWKDQQARSKHRKEINSAIGDVTKHKPSEYWIELLEGAGVPCGPIYSIDQVFADPQVQHSRWRRRCTRRRSATRGGGLGDQHDGFPRRSGWRRRSGIEHGRGAGVGGYRPTQIAEMRKKGRSEMNDFPSGGVTREYARGKMLAAKDDGVGLITFNQP